MVCLFLSSRIAKFNLDTVEYLEYLTPMQQRVL